MNNMNFFDTVRKSLINLSPPPPSKEISNKKNQIAIDWLSLISLSLFHCNYSSSNSPCFLEIAGWPAGVTATRCASLSLYFSRSLSLFLTSRSRSTLINLRACQRLPSASAAPGVQFLWASTRRLTELPCCSSNTQLLITHRTPCGVIKNQGYKGLIAAR